MKSWYRAIMDPDRNALAKLPPAQRFQVMTIMSVMWTTIFCARLSAWAIYGQLVIGHMLVLLGALITGLVFREARRNRLTYRDYPRRDGTARYDDVWGG